MPARKSCGATSRPPRSATAIGSADAKAGIVVRQLLFDGFTSINEIWRQSARVDAAASRVHERTELIALDATEAYIDVVRYHAPASRWRRKTSRRTARSSAMFRRASRADVPAKATSNRHANASKARKRRCPSSAAASRTRGQNIARSVGLEPINLRAPGRLPRLAGIEGRHTRGRAEIQSDAAGCGCRQRARRNTAFMPPPARSCRTRRSKARHLRGDDNGHLFRQSRRRERQGRRELGHLPRRPGHLEARRRSAERYDRGDPAHARLQRDAFESIDKAWAARTITKDRIRRLTRGRSPRRKVIVSYTKEYELGQRTLIDLLNAQNQLFNAYVSLDLDPGRRGVRRLPIARRDGRVIEYLKHRAAAPMRRRLADAVPVPDQAAAHPACPPAPVPNP